jgi:hypothetical protein
MLLAAILLAIDTCASLDTLATWWRTHQPALRLLPPPDLQTAVARKDQRKEELLKKSPPSIVMPAVYKSPIPSNGMLI